MEREDVVRTAFTSQDAVRAALPDNLPSVPHQRCEHYARLGGAPVSHGALRSERDVCHVDGADLARLDLVRQNAKRQGARQLGSFVLSVGVH
jgi:hypothetical protein